MSENTSKTPSEPTTSLKAPANLDEARVAPTGKLPSDALITARLNNEGTVKIAELNAASASQTHFLDMCATIGAASAWPIAAVIIAIIFRSQLRKLIDKISDFKGFGVEAKFGEKLEDLAEQVADNATTNSAPPSADREIIANTEGSSRETEAPFKRIDASKMSEVERELLLSLRPDVAIMDGWLRIQRALFDLSARIGVSEPRGSAYQVIRNLEKLGFIDSPMAEQLQKARHLRNIVAHGHNDTITRSEAALYAQTAAVLASRLEATAI